MPRNALKVRYVLCFGSRNRKGDDLAFHLAKKMKRKGVHWIACHSPEEIFYHMDKEFAILDVAEGIRKVTVLEDASKLQQNRLVSLHDFDVGFFLKLLQKMGRHKIRIVAVPLGYPLKKAETEVSSALERAFRKGKRKRKSAPLLNVRYKTNVNI